MGSISELPDAASPKLVLASPTDDEKRTTWVMNHAEWGGALGLDEYLDREPYLATIPLSENGGMRYWILTDSSVPPEGRPVLSSVETLRKRVLYTTPDSNEIKESVGYGIASVFTDPKLRGRQYASRMLNLLGPMLGEGIEEVDGKQIKPIASALWSDIGKTFYANKGWPAFPSLHVTFRAAEAVGDHAITQDIGLITYQNLEDFSKLDEQLLRKHMASHARDGRPRFAFVPNYDILRWHLYRDEFIANLVFKNKVQSEVKGAVAGQEGRRVWVVWTRNYKGDGSDADKNTMYLLRLVIEDDTAPMEELVSAFGAVLHKAQAEAKQWNLAKLEMWNPSPLVEALIKKSGLYHDVVERQTDSIPSLMWYGEADSNDVEWVANEKFCWC